MNLDVRKDGRRTELYDEDGLHVATIVEQEAAKGKKEGLYAWYTKHNGDHCETFQAAYLAIVKELER